MTFFNIFSKSRTKQNKKLKIEVDFREKDSLVPSYLVSLGLAVEFKHLLVGDYIIKNIAIERKTILDLKSSIVNKRIIKQLSEIKQYPKNFLIIEGNLEKDLYSGIIPENALRGFILSIISKYKVPIIFSHDEKDTAKYIYLLSKKKNKSLSSIRAKKIILSKKEQVQYILEGFPSIGPVTSKKLIEKFGSIKNIINAPETELSQVLGKRTQKFKSLIEY